jgi:hypothetical protein
MSEVQSLIPPRVKKLIERYDRDAGRKRDKAAKKFVTLMALGKNDRALQALMDAVDRGEDAGLGVVGQRHLMEAELRAMSKPKTDRSPEAIDKRQRSLVYNLTSGQRVSLTRAWKHAGYARHHPSWDQLLSSPSVLALFREAIAQGRPLPMKYADRILAAISEPTFTPCQEDIDLGIA